MMPKYSAEGNAEGTLESERPDQEMIHKTKGKVIEQAPAVNPVWSGTPQPNESRPRTPERQMIPQYSAEETLEQRLPEQKIIYKLSKKKASEQASTVDPVWCGIFEPKRTGPRTPVHQMIPQYSAEETLEPRLLEQKVIHKLSKQKASEQASTVDPVWCGIPQPNETRPRTPERQMIPQYSSEGTLEPRLPEQKIIHKLSKKKASEQAST
ncbi:hypothetical protein GGR50DRAFT_675203, partial [Xylaria sp. CBS 124048]